MSIDLSVVIGFRDWGVDRLLRSVRSIWASCGSLDTEVIISDYGSSDPSLSRAVADETGSLWVHTPGDPVWSRARALNAGFTISSGELLISTDADMLFAPGALETIHHVATKAMPCAAFLQCRDLPDDIPDEQLDDFESISWSDLERRSRLRPRWGMGGMMAIDRPGFKLLHGFDERLHTYGREDIDFALRARRAGRRTVWVEDEPARMFHMWHPRSIDSAQATAQGRQALIRNRSIVDNDQTTTRNLTSRRSMGKEAAPLVSVLIIDHGGATNLEGTVATALAQSVRDLEVVICAADPPISDSPVFDDDRVRKIISDSPSGGPPLRKALEACQGFYVEFVEANQLLPLDRTEVLLAAVTEGAAGARGECATLEAGQHVVPGTGSNHDQLAVLRREAVLAVLDSVGSPESSEETVMAGLLDVGFEVRQIAHPVLLDPLAEPTGDTKTFQLSTDQESMLLALLPPHTGSNGGNVHVSLLEPESIDSSLVSSTWQFSEIAFGSQLLRGEVFVTEPTYADLVALADIGSGLTFRDAGGVSGVNDIPWIDSVVAHAVERGLSLPLEVDLDNEEGSAPVSPDTYRVRSHRSDIFIRVHPFGTQEPHTDIQDRHSRWIVIGAEIEEVWT